MVFSQIFIIYEDKWNGQLMVLLKKIYTTYGYQVYWMGHQFVKMKSSNELIYRKREKENRDKHETREVEGITCCEEGMMGSVFLS
jgi:hypothetical protein